MIGLFVCDCAAMQVEAAVAAVGAPHRVQALIQVQTSSPITYQWYRHRQILFNTTLDTVYFYQLGVADAGTGYLCVARFDGAIVSRDWTLNLYSE